MTMEMCLPDVGMGITEATVVKWMKAVGDTVSLDESVAEVETAKSVVEINAPVSGRISEILVPVGAEVEVGAVLALIVAE